MNYRSRPARSHKDYRRATYRNECAFLPDLNEHATQRAFVYTHKWRLYDLVMWDNRQTMHRARAFRDTKQPRDMRRTTIKGDGPTVQQAAA